MADGEQIQDGQGSGDAPVVTRPEYVPETIWDSEKNAPKIDLAATLTEYDTLKASTAERAKLIPASPDEYKFDLPEGFELPAGYTWKADPKDPVVAGFRELATELKMTQPEVQRLVAFEAKRQVEGMKAQQDFDAEQTKQLGANADQRRTAAKTWLNATVTPAQAQVLSTLLDYKDGVEALETVMAKAGGINPRGDAGDGTPINKNAEAAELVGKPGGAMALLRQGNAKN